VNEGREGKAKETAAETKKRERKKMINSVLKTAIISVFNLTMKLLSNIALLWMPVSVFLFPFHLFVIYCLF
jgi:hypothetical protein